MLLQKRHDLGCGQASCELQKHVTLLMTPDLTTTDDALTLQCVHARTEIRRQFAVAHAGVRERALDFATQVKIRTRPEEDT